MNDLNKIHRMAESFRKQLITLLSEVPDLTGVNMMIARNPKTGNWDMDLTVSTSTVVRFLRQLEQVSPGAMHPYGPGEIMAKLMSEATADPDEEEEQEEGLVEDISNKYED